MKSVMIVFLLFFVTVAVINAKPHGSAAMEKGNKERKSETVVIQRQHAPSNMSGESGESGESDDEEADEEDEENETSVLRVEANAICEKQYAKCKNAYEGDDENAEEEDEENVEEVEELKEQMYGHCLEDPYKEYPCDHGHRVGCNRDGQWAGYCWRSCLVHGLYIGFEYPRNKEWYYLQCSDPSLGKKADMECIKKGAGTGHYGKTCYPRFAGKTQ